jgi:hypothetical protein
VKVEARLVTKNCSTNTKATVIPPLPAAAATATINDGDDHVANLKPAAKPSSCKRSSKTALSIAAVYPTNRRSSKKAHPVAPPLPAAAGTAGTMASNYGDDHVANLKPAAKPSSCKRSSKTALSITTAHPTNKRSSRKDHPTAMAGLEPSLHPTANK